MKIRDAFESGIKRFPRQLFDGWFHPDGAGRETQNKYLKTPCASVIGQCMAGVPGVVPEDAATCVDRWERSDGVSWWQVAHQTFPILSLSCAVPVSWAMLRGGLRGPCRNADPDAFMRRHATLGDAALSLNDEWRVDSHEIVDWLSENESQHEWMDHCQVTTRRMRLAVLRHEAFSQDETIHYIRSLRLLEIQETMVAKAAEGFASATGYEPKDPGEIQTVWQMVDANVATLEASEDDEEDMDS